MSDRPLSVEIPYLDPFAAFAPFADEPWAMFLDSAQADPRQGRYSYLALDPYGRITAEGGRALRDGRAVPGSAFACVARALDAGRIVAGPGAAPFQTGALGYFGYELAHELETLPRVPARAPAFPDMAIGLYDAICAFDNCARRAWIVSSGRPERGPAAERRARPRAAELEGRLCAGSGGHAGAGGQAERWPAPNWRADCARARYEAKVARVIDYIRAGDIFQANISRELRAELPEGLGPFRLYGRLRAINPAPFAAYLNLGRVAIVSSSPERFLRLSEGRVETRPIKGTRPRGRTAAEDREQGRRLLASEKDRAENVMIVDLLRNDLSRVCRPHSVEARELCRLESFATVHHLTSTVVGRLEAGAGAIDLLRATFPGGSITGAPKIRAMEIIAELEAAPRGPHYGAIGFLGFDGAADLNIAIRTIAIRDREASVRVGGGIVADSEPAAEFDETVVKAAALLRAAQPMEPGA